MLDEPAPQGAPQLVSTHPRPENNMFTRILAAPSGSLLAAAPLLAVYPTPQVQDLGSLPGVNSSWAAINADGTVATGTAISPTSGAGAAWVWDEQFGYRLLESGGAFETIALFISADGSVALGQSSVAPGVGRTVALWNTSTGQRVDFPIGPDLSLLPAGISADGSVVAGTSHSASEVRRAFLWTPIGGAISLGLLGGTDSHARGISQDGSTIVGDARDAAGTKVAVRWRIDGSVERIPGLPLTATAGSATHVSEAGTYIAGTINDASAPSRIFFHDGITGLTHFGSGAGLSSPVQLRGMSTDGSTLLLERGSNETFLWRPGSTTLIPIEDGGHFQAGAISKNGGAVVGTYTDPSNGLSSAARWERSTGLLIQPGLGGSTSSYRISDDGSTLFGEADVAGGVLRPAIWRSSGQLGANFCAPTALNSSGRLGKLIATGNNSLGTPGLTFQATELPPATTSFVLASRTTTSPMAVAGSSGTLCLGGEVGRLLAPGQLQVTDAAGAFSLEVDPNVLPTPTSGTTAAVFGEAWSFQAWHRDVLVGPLTTSNLTNAVTVRFY